MITAKKQNKTNWINAKNNAGADVDSPRRTVQNMRIVNPPPFVKLRIFDKRMGHPEELKTVRKGFLTAQ